MPELRPAAVPPAAAATHPASAAADRPAYQKFAVAVRPSPIDGLGVFALEPVPRWRKIGEVRGEGIRVAEARRRAATLERIMIVEISERAAVDLAASTDPMRYTNHSCQPNGQLRIQSGRIEFYALRAIDAGEEITVNYGETHHEGRLSCRCGAPGCIGRI